MLPDKMPLSLLMLDAPIMLLIIITPMPRCRQLMMLMPPLMLIICCQRKMLIDAKMPCHFHYLRAP